jgi:hypothetical protein
MIEQDEFELARSYFELKELDRCAWVLRDATSPRARFLRVYATYLVSGVDAGSDARTRARCYVINCL